MLESTEINEIRKLFPLIGSKVNDKPIVYFDSAATTLKPKSVIETLTHFYSYETANVHRGAHTLSDMATEKFEASREKVQKFINAKSSSEIVFTSGTTESINLVASSYVASALKPGDTVLISEMEHHSNIVPWQEVAKANNLNLKWIPVTSKGELDFEAYKKLLSVGDVKFLSLIYCSNTLGTINPIEKFISEAKSKNIKVLIDAAQAMAFQKVDVQALDSDFLVFSSHKIFGPYGHGVLYGKIDLLNSMPVYQTGGSMISKVSKSGTSFLSSPQRFEAGTPHIAGALGLATAIDFVESIGQENIHEYEQKLLAFCTEELNSLPGLDILGEAPSKTSIISFLMQNIHPSDVGQLLDQYGFAVRVGHHCTQPLMDALNIPGTVRASFSIYNTTGEIEQFIESLKKVKEFF